MWQGGGDGLGSGSSARDPPPPVMWLLGSGAGAWTGWDGAGAWAACRWPGIGAGDVAGVRRKQQVGDVVSDVPGRVSPAGVSPVVSTPLVVLQASHPSIEGRRAVSCRWYWCWRWRRRRQA